MPESTTDPSRLYDAILTGDAPLAVEVTQSDLAAGADPDEMVTQQMIQAMDEVGRRFDGGEFYIPDMVIAARAMKAALELIRPRLVERGVEPAGHVVVGTVKGDLHDIGKGLVASMLEGGGFEVIDLGVDVPADRFVEEARQSGAQIVALSALLTTTMKEMKTVVEAIRDAGLGQQCRIVVGGAPVTQQYADSIGADGYSESAAGAVALARQFVQGAN